MKNIIKLFTFPLLTIIGFNSCASIPLKIGESENNSTYKHPMNNKNTNLNRIIP